MKPVWVVDDDASIRWVLSKALARAGLQASVFASAGEALRALAGESPSVLVTDLRMPGEDGLALMAQFKQRQPGLPVIVMTAYSDLDSTVAAFQHGAFEYLAKPFDLDEAVGLIVRAAHSASADPGETAATVPDGEGGDIMMQSSAPAMQDVFRAIGRLAGSHATVLVTGESGTGKELVARALHVHSQRAQGPFVALNAAAIPRDLLEAELFGHERGAFTGAAQQRQGRFEQARHGTLFLDEIGDMPFELQTRLLRVLAEGSFYRVGGSEPIRMEARIVAATHQPLEQRVAQGHFREDLFHRLNVIRLRLPPLRERKADIPALAQHFMQRSARSLGVAPRRLTPAALERLTAFDYPGNIRQLENFCQWMTVMSASPQIGPKDLPPELLAAPDGAQPALPDAAGQPEVAAPGVAASGVPASGAAAPGISAPGMTVSGVPSGGVPAPGVRAFDGGPADEASQAWLAPLAVEARRRLVAQEPDVMGALTRDFERVLLRSALSISRGRRAQAAERLGIGRNTLTRKCKELGLDDEAL